MLAILFVVQIVLAVLLIGIILLQRSQSDGVSGLSGGSGGNMLMSGRASANALTKTTALLAFLFMANSLVMAAITAREKGFAEQFAKPVPTHQESAPATDVKPETTPTEPSVPVSDK